MTVLKKPRTEKQLANDKRLGEASHATALFKTPEEFVAKFEEYLKTEDANFSKRPPSFSRFADWMNVPRRTIMEYPGKWPKADETVRRMMADILAEHTVVGDYRDAPGIFALKNICGWVDKRENISRSRTPDIATPDEARSNVQLIKRSLGYDDHGRPGKIGKQNMEEMENRIIQLAAAKSE